VPDIAAWLSCGLSPFLLSTERRFPPTCQNSLSVQFPEELDEGGDDTGPAGLMARPDVGIAATAMPPVSASAASGRKRDRIVQQRVFDGST
jgi:hypothetical protein